MAVEIEEKVNSELAALMKVWAQEQGWDVDGWNWESDWRQDWGKAYEIFNLIAGDSAKCEISSIDCRETYVEGMEVYLPDYFKLSDEERKLYDNECEASHLKRDAIFIENKSFSIDSVKPVPYVLCKYIDDIPDRISHVADFLYGMLYIFSEDDDINLIFLRDATDGATGEIHLVNFESKLENHLQELKVKLKIHPVASVPVSSKHEEENVIPPNANEKMRRKYELTTKLMIRIFTASVC